MAQQEFRAQPMNGKSAGRHVALRIDVLVIDLAGGDMIDHFDAADFHQPVSVDRIKPGGFGIEDDFAHRGSGG